jgi:hypothetical protein
MRAKIKVDPCILMPCYGSVPVLTMSSLVGVILNLGIGNIKFSAGLSMVSHARDKLVDEFLKTKCTHAVFIDSDMVFTPQDLKSLLTRELDIVGGLACKEHDGKIEMASTLVEGAEIDGRRLLEAHTTGMAFISIRREVFEHMIEHYGDGISYLPGGIKRYHLFPEFEFGKFASEDGGFCYRARELGYKIWLDTNVRVGHMGWDCYPLPSQLALMKDVFKGMVTWGRKQELPLPYTSSGKVWNE